MTPEDLERIIHHWGAVGEDLEPGTWDYEFHIAMKNCFRRRNWKPTKKQEEQIERLFTAWFYDTADGYQVLD